MGQIKINGSFFGEEIQRENNYSLEYLKRTLTEHKIKPTLDHPDGSVTEEKLSAEVRDRMTKHESDIQEFNEKKADKSELDTKADKADTDKEFDEVKENHSAHVLDNNCHFMYGEREEINQRISSLKTTKADKATTYTIAQTDTKLSAKADKAYTYTKAEVDSIVDDVKEKVDDYLIPETSSLSAQLIYVGENKADKSELPTKVSQLENDKNYVTPEEIQPIYQDINYLDTQTRNLEAKKADKFDTYTATETDDMLSTKADKADLDWKLIGEEVVTAADITAAGEAGVTAVTIDFGKPIDSWYSETMVITAIPRSSAINNFTNGKLAVVFGKTEEGAINRSDGSPALVASQGNNALLTPAWNQQHIITSNWLGKKVLTHSYVNYRGYNAATGYTVSPYTTESWSYKANSILNCRYLAVIGSYNAPNANPVEKIIFKFPAGSKISIYGRM